MSKHLDPAWGAKETGITESGEIIFVDAGGESFTLETSGDNVGRVEHAGAKKADATRLRHARAALKALNEAAEEAGVGVEVILSLGEE